MSRALQPVDMDVRVCIWNRLRTGVGGPGLCTGPAVAGSVWPAGAPGGEKVKGILGAVFDSPVCERPTDLAVGESPALLAA